MGIFYMERRKGEKRTGQRRGVASYIVARNQTRAMAAGRLEISVSAEAEVWRYAQRMSALQHGTAERRSLPVRCR